MAEDDRYGRSRRALLGEPYLAWEFIALAHELDLSLTGLARMLHVPPIPEAINMDIVREGRWDGA